MYAKLSHHASNISIFQSLLFHELFFPSKLFLFLIPLPLHDPWTVQKVGRLPVIKKCWTLVNFRGQTEIILSSDSTWFISGVYMILEHFLCTSKKYFKIQTSYFPNRINQFMNGVISDYFFKFCFPGFAGSCLSLTAWYSELFIANFFCVLKPKQINHFLLAW